MDGLWIAPFLILKLQDLCHDCSALRWGQGASRTKRGPAMLSFLAGVRRPSGLAELRVVTRLRHSVT